jgi:hypothetical protein
VTTVPDPEERGWHVVPPLVSGTVAFQKDVKDGHLSVFVGKEPSGWHLSISHRQVRRGGHPTPGRLPTWEELVEARYLFTPQDVTMVQHLPPYEEYINIHPTTFHLWELHEE